MRKVLKIIFKMIVSVKTMSFLFITIAVGMGLGTFIEHWYNTSTAQKLVYNSSWFELTLILFAINFLGNIKRYKLYQKRKWPVLLVHVSLIIILIGASFTRYFGYEGTMSIREGETTNIIVSSDNHLSIQVEGDHNQIRNILTIRKPLKLAVIGNNDFRIKDEITGTPFQVTNTKFVINAKEEVIQDNSGFYYVKITIAREGESETIYLRSGEVTEIKNTLLTFNKPKDNAINIVKNGENYNIKSPIRGSSLRMSDGITEVVNDNEYQRMRFKWLYQLDDIQIVFDKIDYPGILKYVPEDYSEDNLTLDILKLQIAANDEVKKVIIKGNQGMVGEPHHVTVGGLRFTLSFGSKKIRVPFSIQLKEFEAKKYPGTKTSYSSFKSYVSVLDEGKSIDSQIYMNNVLDYDGYRFFQASFHPDEKGTVLSVNHDRLGTNTTYAGYYLLYLSLLLILIDKNSRFGVIRKRLYKRNTAKMALPLILLMLFPLQGFAQSGNINSVIKDMAVDQTHASKFGQLVIQDGNGRMKPINTYSSELLRKLYEKDSFLNLSPDQVFISILMYPELWYEVPIIKIEENNRLREILNLDLNTSYISLSKLLYENGGYKLTSYLGNAYRAVIPNKFQEALIELDDKANLLNFALSGKALRIFPVPNDANNKWVSNHELSDVKLRNDDSIFIKNILSVYYSSLSSIGTDKEYKIPNDLLEKIEAYQLKFGKEVRLSDQKIAAEIFYNKINLFEKMRSWYLIIGLLIIIFGILNIVDDKSIFFIKLLKGLYFIAFFLFALHTFGLILRWYISGHAPWSDAYESMIYVAWATVFFGIIFGRRSILTLGSSIFISSIILVVAHWNWMDPAIANLQPVLNSYWLMIHVAIIVASYGPFTLGMILALICQFLILITNDKNRNNLKSTITELLYIVELSITIGLVMLVIGNFLGGQWANESWGRYWGWDPKETWALISIMVYALVIHLRLIPSLNNKWLFSLVCVLAYASILMTYFGVNFYLTGLHSYASGDKVISQSFIYYTLLSVILLSSFSWYKHKIHY